MAKTNLISYFSQHNSLFYLLYLTNTCISNDQAKQCAQLILRINLLKSETVLT